MMSENSAPQPPEKAGLHVQAVAGLEAVSFGYTRRRPVLHEINGQIMPGRVTALVGPNAAGKSTLIRVLLGAVTPWTGTVTLGGLELSTLSPAVRARWISYVPQRTGGRFAYTVGQMVAMAAPGHLEPGHSAVGTGNTVGQQVDQVLHDAGLTPIADRVFAELSGGQQQQVLLARAEYQARHSGRLMLLDEPASHLDLRHAHQTMQRLRGLAAAGLAVLVVVHDLNLALRYADDAWLMDEGRLVASGTWQQVLTPEVLSPVYGVGLHQIIEPSQPRPVLLVEPGGKA